MRLLYKGCTTVWPCSRPNQVNAVVTLSLITSLKDKLTASLTVNPPTYCK